MTSAVAAELDADGNFIVPAPPLGPGVAISSVRADTIAELWSQQLGPDIDSFLTAGHGAAIVYRLLRLCGRTFYSATPFLLPPTLDSTAQRGFGSWWLVTLCQDGEPTLSVAVSALASDITITDGTLRFPLSGGGNEFFAIGIPGGWNGAVPDSPERAAIAAAQATGRLVAAVPTLVGATPFRGEPQEALWRITLDAPATFDGLSTGQRLTTTVIYQGMISPPEGGPFIPALAVPLPNQPASDTVILPNGQHVAVLVDPSKAVLFEEAAADSR